jgi:hypothetical protein
MVNVEDLKTKSEFRPLCFPSSDRFEFAFIKVGHRKAKRPDIGTHNPKKLPKTIHQVDPNGFTIHSERIRIHFNT